MSDPTDSTTTAPRKASASGISDKDYLDALSKVYAEAMEQSRHQEAMRSVVSGFIITLTAASVGALGFFFRDGRYPTALALAVAAFVVLLGLFGAVFVVRTEYMRWQLKEGASAIQKHADELLKSQGYGNPGEMLRIGRENTDRKLKSRGLLVRWLFWPAARISRWSLWLWFMLVIVMLGMAFAGWIAASASSPILIMFV